MLFDWGGTLSTSNNDDLLGMWRHAALVLAPADPEPLAQRLLEAEHAWWDERVGVGDGTGSGRTEDIIRSVADDTHLDVLGALAAYHGAWDARVGHEDCAAEVLQGIRDRGWRTGLLSNTHWPRDQHERWLSEAGLLGLLDARVYTSDLRHMKPHAEAFLALTSALGVEPAQCVFVGDRPRDDIAGAQGAGLRTVLLTGRDVPAFDVVPDAAVPELSDLPAVLDAWA
ncbi:MAG: HAD-superfamily hydrolase, subfamily variant 3 [Frankiales bacterium]|nr:HAD-superfamily hydrolase, subfamily variant 3 [Frankiales bacterium]